MVEDTQSLLEVGELWVYAHSHAAVASGASVDIGVLTGDVPVRVLSRVYQSTGSPLAIQLFEVDWTGGSPISQIYNRNLDYKNAPRPAEMLAGVTFTPNTPEISALVQAENATGQARLTATEADPIGLKKNKKYVLRLLNQHNNLATISCSITLRRKQASETLR